MALSEQYFQTDELDPIDIVEHLAEYHDWEFDRVAEDQIAMMVQGQWRNYSLTLAWSPRDETLRLICTFEMEPPEDRLGRAAADGLSLRAAADRRADGQSRTDRRHDRRRRRRVRAVLSRLPACGLGRARTRRAERRTRRASQALPRIRFC